MFDFKLIFNFIKSGFALRFTNLNNKLNELKFRKKNIRRPNRLD
jgi:hypothetical protein